MGYGSYSTVDSATRAAARMTTGDSGFHHHAAAAAGLAPRLHPTLDVRQKPQREARDSVDSPASFPVAVLLDVTGSMADIPPKLINEFHQLMKVVKDRGVVEHPAICFGAIGDATCDSVPLQVGEFEARDTDAEAHLANLYLEAGGGGQATESYELALWFFTERVQTDHYEKRGGKGILFVVGDEAPYPTVKRREVEAHVGPNLLLEDLPTADMAVRLKEKWEVFCIRPGGTGHFASDRVHSAWTQLLGEQNVARIEDWNAIVPYMAGNIAVVSGLDLTDTVTLLKDSGFDPRLIADAERNLAGVASAMVPVVSAGAELVGAGSGPAGRRL